MRLIGILLLFIFQLSFAQPQQITQRIDALELGNDKEKIEFLMYLKNQYPGMFAGASNYEVDLLGLLDKQVALEKELFSPPAQGASEDEIKRYEEFKNLYAEYRKDKDYLTFSSRLEGEIEVVKKELKQKEFEDFKQKITGVIESQEMKEFPDDLLKEYKRLLSTSDVGNLDGILTGVYNSLLPQEKLKDLDRGAFFKLSPNEKIQFLTDMTSESSQQKLRDFPKFKTDRFSSITPEMSIGQLMDKLRSLQETEDNLKSLHQLFVFTIRNGYLPPSKAFFLDAIKELDESKFDYFQDKAVLNERVQEILKAAAIEEPSKDTEKLVSGINKKTTSEIRTFFTKTVEKEIASGIRLDLVEKPARIGIFRSCLGGRRVGGDCATEYSYAYADSPVEKQFLIISESGKTNGTLSATIVEIQEGDKTKKALYVHTIQGRPVTGQMTKQILQTLYQNRGTLGVDEIVLPEAGRLPALLNFEPIRAVVKAEISEKKAVELNYLDKETRDFLGSKVKTQVYDSHHNNQRGVVYLPEEKEIKNLKTEHQKLKYDQYLTPKIAKEDFILFAMDLVTMGQDQTAERVLSFNELDIKTEQLQELYKVLQNEEKLNNKEYFSKAQSEFKKLGLTLDEDFITERRHYFEIGSLKSPDAFNETNIARNLDSLLELIPVNEVIGEQVHNGIYNPFGHEMINLVINNQKELLKQPKFKNYLLKLIEKDRLKPKLFLYLLRNIDFSLASDDVAFTKKIIDSILSSSKEEIFGRMLNNSFQRRIPLNFLLENIDLINDVESAKDYFKEYMVLSDSYRNTEPDIPLKVNFAPIYPINTDINQEDTPTNKLKRYIHHQYYDRQRDLLKINLDLTTINPSKRKSLLVEFDQFFAYPNSVDTKELNFSLENFSKKLASHPTIQEYIIQKTTTNIDSDPKKIDELLSRFKVEYNPTLLNQVVDSILNNPSVTIKELEALTQSEIIQEKILASLPGDEELKAERIKLLKKYGFAKSIDDYVSTDMLDRDVKKLFFEADDLTDSNKRFVLRLLMRGLANKGRRVGSVGRHRKPTGGLLAELTSSYLENARFTDEEDFNQFYHDYSFHKSYHVNPYGYGSSFPEEWSHFLIHEDPKIRSKSLELLNEVFPRALGGAVQKRYINYDHWIQLIMQKDYESFLENIEIHPRSKEIGDVMYSQVHARNDLFKVIYVEDIEYHKALASKMANFPNVFRLEKINKYLPAAQTEFWLAEASRNPGLHNFIYKYLANNPTFENSRFQKDIYLFVKREFKKNPKNFGGDYDQESIRSWLGKNQHLDDSPRVRSIAVERETNPAAKRKSGIINLFKSCFKRSN